MCVIPIPHFVLERKSGRENNTPRAPVILFFGKHSTVRQSLLCFGLFVVHIECVSVCAWPTHTQVCVGVYIRDTPVYVPVSFEGEKLCRP